jgi:hypothetical protein
MLDDDGGKVEAVIALHCIVAANIILDTVAKITLFRNPTIFSAIFVLGKESNDRSSKCIGG